MGVRLESGCDTRSGAVCGMGLEVGAPGIEVRPRAGGRCGLNLEGVCPREGQRVLPKGGCGLELKMCSAQGWD